MTDMKTLTAAILDDEPLARKMLEEYLDSISWIEISHSLGDPTEAVDIIKTSRPDILFLDIEMPELNGFEVLARLGDNTPPKLIFSTAFDQFAIRAFEVNAIDYLLKPYSEERFSRAIEKIRKQEDEKSDLRKRVNALVEQMNANSYPSQIYIRRSTTVEPVETDDIIWIEADGDYSTLHLTDGKIMCGMGIGELVKQLNPDRFFRIHRSHAVSKDFIRELVPNGYGGFIACLTTGKELKVSRHYAKKIKERLI